MSIRQQGIGMVLGLAVGVGGATFLGASHSRALAAEEKHMTNADFAREASDHLKKAHEAVNHLVNDSMDKKEKGYSDAESAQRDIDRAEKSITKYIGYREAEEKK